MKKKHLIILFFGGTVLLNSCNYDNFKELHPETSKTSNTCDTTSSISYSAQIVPILNSSCTNNCHNGVGSGHDISSHATASLDALSGSLYSSVVWDGNAQQMPQGASSKISDCDIAKIRLWAAQGALNN